MGQSILSHRRKPFRSGVDSGTPLSLVCVVSAAHDHCTWRKGIGLIFPNSASDIVLTCRKAGQEQAVTQTNSDTPTHALGRVVFSS
ncbi:hypothetical protein E4K58_26540 [Escherichia coli]|nr:hypothetical protein [Escherichia coli]MQS28096.1 hypothetical protein [Escherichia coli]